MIPRFRPVLTIAELLAALRPATAYDIEDFEAAFASAVGQRHAVAFPYGRTGLLVLLDALGLKSRDIICPAYTCVVVPHAVVIGGNNPRFIDSLADANMDLAAAERAISPNTGALIATSIFGNPVDLNHLEDIARRNPQITIIQDCAHAFTATSRGRSVNQSGTAAIFGMNASKIMTSIFGGMVTTDDPNLARALRARRSAFLKPAPLSKSVARALYLLALYPAFWPPLFGITERLRKAGLLDRFTRYYDEAAIDMPRGYDCALTAIEARIGTTQLKSLKAFIDARRAYAAYYRQALSDQPALSWIDGAQGCTYSHIAARVADRSHVMRAAARRGIQLGEVIEYSVPELTAYRAPDAQAIAFPVAQALSRQTINLPLAGRFDTRAAARTAAVLRDILADQPVPPVLPLASS